MPESKLSDGVRPEKVASARLLVGVYMDSPKETVVPEIWDEALGRVTVVLGSDSESEV